MLLDKNRLLLYRLCRAEQAASEVGLQVSATEGKRRTHYHTVKIMFTVKAVQQRVEAAGGMEWNVSHEWTTTGCNSGVVNHREYLLSDLQQ